MKGSTDRLDPLKSAQPPDGGWGWVVMCSVFMISFVADGVNLTFGVFFSEYLSFYGESKGKTQMLHSVSIGTMFGTGPLAAALVNKFGTRRVTISGSIIFGVGIFLSTFSPNLDIMILLYGIVGGFGFGLMYIPSIVIVGIYFDKRRALATGIAMCGSGIGCFAFAPIYEVLLTKYGWRGALLIMSAITLNGTVAASLFRPLGRSCQKSEQNESNTCNDGEQVTRITWNKCCTHVCAILTDVFDTSLLSRPVVVVSALSSFLFMLGSFVPYNFLPALANDLHLSTFESSLLISIIGISDTMTRILVGYISDKPWANSILINNVVLITGGVATIFVPFYGQFEVLAVYAIVTGATIGVFMTLRTIIMVELLGIQNLSRSYGLMSLSMGISSFAGSPIGGALSDWRGDYDIVFYAAGISMALSGVIGLSLQRIAKWENKRHVDISDYNEPKQETNIKLAYIKTNGYLGEKY
ncbi:monocarboxylate transporter 13-like isoform X1 [Pecten maximus]|uniref:monocarboxylate transporter 13-like isoform X1 n=1 Tax=Pecten maximus TaxID=6579 RepID=UPI0014588E85|nr:monocarboxylate transporter 13-like isoform X1 [Pecten maximus]XP_033724503.1 monocarboxylate transporter 13-like isoform X1 [Pecten maximus]XP_033724505.1 monocarboxylate transporter 13-like isoform X1 [Pecten maximus]